MNPSIPQRVLMTADTVGGVWTYAMELVRELGRQGVEVVLATMGERLSRSQAEQASELRNLEVFESEFKLEWMPRPWQEVDDAGDWLLYLEGLVEPDLIHLNGYAHGSLSWRSPVVVVGHSCVLSWWRSVYDSDAPAEWSEYRTRISRGLAAADRVVAPSRAMLEALIEHYGPIDNARVIYNGRSSRSFHTARKEEIILTAGRLWDEAKNVSAVGEIAASLPWEVRVAGETVVDRDGENSASAQLSAQNIRALGYLTQEQLAIEYSRASIYVLPARYEPFGLTAVEAALSGCALVLGDIPSLREIWQDAAIFVDPADPAAVKAAVMQLIDNDEVRAEMAMRGRRRALYFSPERMASRYIDLYAELLQRPVPQSLLSREVSVCA